jgi:hypothetical protein
MKNCLPLVLLCILLATCKKSSVVVEDKVCYQCKSSTPPRNWQDVGCFTESEWNNFSLTDASGNPVDKNTNCRTR